MPLTTRVISAFADHKGSPFFFEAISKVGSTIKPGHLLRIKQTTSTAAGATTNADGYAVGATVITLAAAGTGTIVAGDEVTFAGDSQSYLITVGDTNVNDGGAITIAVPGLQLAIGMSATAITVEASIGDVERHSVAGGTAEKIIADIDPTVGGTVETVYAADSTVRIGSYQTGQEVFLRVAAAGSITNGDALQSAGDGTVQSFTPVATDLSGQLIGFARETIDNSGGSAEVFVLARIA